LPESITNGALGALIKPKNPKQTLETEGRPPSQLPLTRCRGVDCELAPDLTERLRKQQCLARKLLLKLIRSLLYKLELLL